LLALICVLVCIGTYVSTRLSLAIGTVSCIWIANGIISAFILTAPARYKILFFAAGQLTNLSVDLVLGDAFVPACWYLLCNSAEVLVAVLSLRHFQARSEIVTGRALRRIAFFGILLGPLTCAVLAAPVISIVEGRSLLEAIRIWFLSDALGCAATLPPLLFLLTHERNTRAWRDRVADGALACVLLSLLAAIFWQTRYPLLFLLFPPLAALLFRFRLAGAIYGTAVVLVLAAAFTAEGHGPFALDRGATRTERVILFQIFGLITFGSCIPLGFSIEERHRLQENLQKVNERLSQLALLDSLTGAQNRRGFDATMETEWSSACASGGEISLLYLDIDFFKRFNDTYGHQRGDDCLRSVANALIGVVRGSDRYVARYGGEEFVVLLPGAPSDSARATAERITATILELNIPHRESPFGLVTASVGIATVRPRDGGTADELIRLADDALYRAKRGGRSRIEMKPECGRAIGWPAGTRSVLVREG
jgi:diguanylate cyclase (GGDEF)-like protein